MEKLFRVVKLLRQRFLRFVYALGILVFNCLTFCPEPSNILSEGVYNN